MTAEQHNADQHHDDSFGHEPNVMSGRVVAIAFIGVIVLMIAATVLAVVWLRTVDAQRAESDAAAQKIIHAPQLRSEPALDPQTRQSRAASLAEDETLLSSYETIDAENKIARIPIDRAMKILAAEGLPTREEEEPNGKP